MTLKQRIEKALEDFTKGRASMHVPPLDTDVDVVLAECSDRLPELEARCAALAAEIQAVKALARGWANATDDRLFEEHGEIFHDSIDACEEELKTISPATDAFLAEVRASGVDTFGDYLNGLGWDEEDIKQVREFAAKLRKGGAKEEKQSFLSDEDCHAFVKAFTKGAAQ